MTREKKTRIALLSVLILLVVLITVILAVLLPLFEAYRDSYVNVDYISRDTTDGFQWGTVPPDDTSDTDTAEGTGTEPSGTETVGDTETEEITTVPPETDPIGWQDPEQGVDEDGIYLVKQKDPNVINILLIGTDSRNVQTTRGRSDSMIVCSYNKKTGKVTLVSLLRDTLVPIEGVGTFYQKNYNIDVTKPNQSLSSGGGKPIPGYVQLSGGYGYAKLNFAYNYGGASCCINTINDLYGLDIQKFVIINFAGASDLVDAVGGVDVPLGKEEYANLTNQGHTLVANGDGTYHLNGKQALAHMRNRGSKFGNTSLDDDFARTARQRQVITAIYQQVVASRSVSEIYNLIREAFGIVRTNLNLSDLLDLAGSVLEYGIDMKIESKQAPYGGGFSFVSYPVAGSSVAIRDIPAHRKWLETQLYS